MKRKQKHKKAVRRRKKQAARAYLSGKGDLYDGPVLSGKKKKVYHSSQPSTFIARHDFSDADWQVQCTNPYGRCIKNPEKTATVLLSDSKPGVILAEQYFVPVEKAYESEGDDEDFSDSMSIDSELAEIARTQISDAPEDRPLDEFQVFYSVGKSRVRAKSPGGTDLYATEVLDIEVDGEAKKLALFRSLYQGKEKEKGRPFFSDDTSPPVLKEGLKQGKKHACLKSSKTSCKSIDVPVYKTQELDIDYAVVRRREENSKRSMSQKKAMGITAAQAVGDFAKKHKKVLSEGMQWVFNRSLKAPRDHSIDSQASLELCHLAAHSLHPDPQKKTNLVAAPKHANTKMMLLERWAKWLALNCPDSSAFLKCQVALLHGDWRIAQKIDLSVISLDNGVKVKIDLSIDPWVEQPAFSPAAHIGQVILAASSLHRKKPAKCTLIHTGDPAVGVEQFSLPSKEPVPDEVADIQYVEAKRKEALPTDAQTYSSLPKFTQNFLALQARKGGAHDDSSLEKPQGMLTSFQKTRALDRQKSAPVRSKQSEKLKA